VGAEVTLTVVIPRYAMKAHVAQQADDHLATLIDVAQLPTQIIVVDNGSTHPMRDALRASVTLIAWPTNRGIAPAWNEGMAHAGGQLLAFVTTTTRVTPGWDTALASACHERVIAMPYTNGEKAYGVGVTGWCFMLRRELAREIGSFDETFVPCFYEDTSWFHDAIDKGVELVNVPAANVLKTTKHATVAEAPWGGRMSWLFYANRLRYSWKHNVDPYDTPRFWQRPLRDVA
jgi:GT2 family glycosyltransferase